MKKKYKLIFLDADNTLFDYKKGEEAALTLTLDEFKITGKTGSYLENFNIINQALWIELENGTVTKDELRVERFRKLFKDEALNFNVEDFALKYIGNLSKQAHLIEGAAAVCCRLSSKYTLAIITNGIKEVQCSRIVKSGISRYVKHIIVSEEAGFNKPHPGIFEYAFRISGHKDKNDALMVGDSLSSDIAGGRNFGIDTCWFNPEGLELTVDFEPTYIIERLEELNGILQ